MQGATALMPGRMATESFDERRRVRRVHYQRQAMCFWLAPGWARAERHVEIVGADSPSWLAEAMARRLDCLADWDELAAAWWQSKAANRVERRLDSILAKALGMLVARRGAARWLDRSREFPWPTDSSASAHHHRWRRDWSSAALTADDK